MAAGVAAERTIDGQAVLFSVLHRKYNGGRGEGTDPHAAQYTKSNTREERT